MALSGIGAVAVVDTGYATAIYHNRGERQSKIVFGRQYECTLRDSGRREAQSCAIQWCEDWCERSGNSTCRCRTGRVADFLATGDVTDRDRSVNRYSRKRQR
jgi:hypothetical protein